MPDLDSFIGSLFSELYKQSDVPVPKLQALQTSGEAWLTRFFEQLDVCAPMSLPGFPFPDPMQNLNGAYPSTGLKSIIPQWTSLSNRVIDSQDKFCDINSELAEGLLTLGFAVFACMEQWLTVDLPRSVQIDIETLVKDFERSETPVGRLEGLRELVEGTIAHIQRLSRLKSTSQQHHEESRNVAAANAKLCSPLPQDPGTIRLVVLLPSTDRAADIECVLCQENLNHEPQYEALSYAVLVNNVSFKATKNLHTALRHLRYWSSPRVLWIDAICINQDDIPERNQQVQQMRDVYQKAAKVLVWLGSESNSTAFAMDFMKTLPSRAIGPHHPTFDSTGGKEKQKEIDSRVNSLLLDPLIRPHWSALVKFMQRPWWGRIRVSQEIAVARKATFLCGNLRMSLEVVENFVWFFVFSSPLLKKISYRHSPANNALIANILDRAMPMSITLMGRILVQNSFVKGGPLDLTTLLNNSKFLECTNPRDCLYALFGMIFASGYGDDLLKPNYNLSAVEIYIKVAVHMLKSRQNLDLLSHICHDCRGIPCRDKEKAVELSGLPSWVPEWSSMGLEISIQFENLRGDEPVYQASLGEMSRNWHTFLEQDTVLQVEGVRLNKIHAIGRMARKDTFRSACRQWRSMIPQADDDVYRGNHRIREAFWRTILWNQDNHYARLRDRVEDIAFPYPIADQQKRVEGKVSRGMHLYRGSVDPIVFPPSTAEQEDKIKDLIEESCRTLHLARRFFRTATGYIGLGPTLARPGDIVVILLGGLIPYILRPSGKNRSTFLGDCYVHGVMDGEVILAQRRGEYHMEKFELD